MTAPPCPLAVEVAALVADRPRHRYSAGAAAKGPRFYLWAWARIDADRPGGHRRLLIRRHPLPGEPTFYRCRAPRGRQLITRALRCRTRWGPPTLGNACRQAAEQLRERQLFGHSLIDPVAGPRNLRSAEPANYGKA
ncbi:hypothetical protein GCM10010517_71030 [Streptosporangium fragile]|uniref:Integrase n=1 Tax=Streptosporangium fragile TaxID=46186 RepID=A0ABN3W8L4_9ACTN